MATLNAPKHPHFQKGESFVRFQRFLPWPILGGKLEEKGYNSWFILLPTERRGATKGSLIAENIPSLDNHCVAVHGREYTPIITTRRCWTCSLRACLFERKAGILIAVCLLNFGLKAALRTANVYVILSFYSESKSNQPKRLGAPWT